MDGGCDVDAYLLDFDCYRNDNHNFDDNVNTHYMVTGDDDRDVDDDDYYNDVDISFSNRADDISGFGVYLFFK